MNTTQYPSPPSSQGWQASNGKGQSQWGQNWSAQRPSWGNSKGKGKGKGACYSCGQRGHIARFCPNMVQSSPQFVGTARVNAVAGDIIQSANNYEVGGINNVSTDVLHEQMGDEWGEAETAEVAHVAIGWATNLLSPTCGNSTTRLPARQQSNSLPNR